MSRDLHIYIYAGICIVIVGLFAVAAAVVHAAEPPRACVPIAAVRAQMEAAAKTADLDVAELYGIPAFRALDFLNNKVGERTDLRADTIIAMPLVAQGMVAIQLGQYGCATEHLTVSAKAFAAALGAAMPRIEVTP